VEYLENNYFKTNYIEKKGVSEMFKCKLYLRWARKLGSTLQLRSVHRFTFGELVNSVRLLTLQLRSVHRF